MMGQQRKDGCPRPRLLLVGIVLSFAVFNFVTTLQWAGRITTTTTTAANDDASNDDGIIALRMQQQQQQHPRVTVVTDQSKEAHVSMKGNVADAQGATTATGNHEPSNNDVVVKDNDDWPPTSMLNNLLGSTTPNNKRRLVVAASNAEFVDFADNFAHSLVSLNVTNFVLVPLDEGAYQALHKAYPQHTLPLVPGLRKNVHLTGEAAFGSDAFKILTASRPMFLRPFLEKGYTILYNDIDMVWQHNAWDTIDERNHKIIQNDKTKSTSSMMLWHDGPGQLCTCMLYLLPTPASISLLNKWEQEILTQKYDTDQFAFIALAKRLKFPFGGGTTATGDVTVYRSDEQFPPGKFYSWDRTTAKNEKAVIVHNNWIKGKQEKRTRFESAGLWKPSGRVPEPQLLLR
jgi:Nucleotide-diphospho-sugar transferase